MADEIMEAIQMLRFGYDGIRLGLDVTGSTIREVKNITIFIVGLLNHEKRQGKTSLKKMLKTSGNLQVLQIKEGDVKQFEKLANKYGILYSKMPDINKGDGMTEFIFPVEAVPRINALIEKLGDGRVEDISDYVKNGDGSFEETIKYLKGKGLLPEKMEITPERMEELKEMSRNIKYNESINDLNKVDITLSRGLVADETKDAFLTRVPGTYGENIRYLSVKKEDIILINNGKTFLSFLEKDKEYELLDKEKKPVQKVKGEELRNNHYDEVNRELRKKAEQKRDKEEKLKKDKKQREKEKKKEQEKTKKTKKAQEIRNAQKR